MNEKLGQSAGARGVFYLERAEMLMTALRFEDARKQFLLALGEDPDNAEIHCRLGVCCAKLGEFDSAIEHGKTAAALGPDNALVFQNLGWIYHKADQDKLAKAAVKEAIRIEPNFADAYTLLASVYIQLSEFRKAARCAKKAISLEPDCSDAHRVMAIATQQLDEDWESERSLRQAFRNDPNNAATHLVMGTSRLKQLDYEPAERHFREALRLDPTSEAAKELLVIVKIETSPIVRWHATLAGWIEIIPWRLLIILGVLCIAGLSRGNGYAIACLVPLAVAVLILLLTRFAVDPVATFQVACTSLGRNAMSRWDFYGSMLLSFMLLGIAGLGIAGIALSSVPILVVVVFGTYLYFPIFSTWQIATEKMRPVMFLTVAGLAVVGSCLLVFSLWTTDETNRNSLIGLWFIYVVACLVSLSLPRIIKENLS